MREVADAVYWWVFGTGLVAILTVLFFDKNCDCRRQHPPYFYLSHAVRYMYAVAVFETVMSILSILTGPIGAIFWVLFCIKSWLAVYYHEKDKIKKAAKVLGRVIVTGAGLKVQPQS